MINVESRTWRGQWTPSIAPAGLLQNFARGRVLAALDGLTDGAIRIVDAAGVHEAGTGADPVTVTVHDPRFYLDVMIAGSNGAASAYRDGFWSSSSLTELFRLLLRNADAMDSFEAGSARMGNWWLGRRHAARRNDRSGSRRNIHAHYDLGNDMFALFLDPTMTYSSGIYPSADSSLEQASREKLDRICRKLGLSPDHHVLEIGCGWGSFALHAARHYGCRVTAATISRAQHELATRRVREAGLADRIEVVLRDYRDLAGRYDRIVSIEMIEAVGHEFLPLYFRRCAELLAPDGQMLLQGITMPDHRYDRYLRTSDFIQQFIFPGSCVPSLGAMLGAMSAAGLRATHIEDFGPDYARTLRAWLGNFREREREVRALGYGDDFLRLWEYYLCYCEAGFLEHYTGVVQVLINGPRCRQSAPLFP